MTPGGSALFRGCRLFVIPFWAPNSFLTRWDRVYKRELMKRGDGSEACWSEALHECKRLSAVHDWFYIIKMSAHSLLMSFSNQAVSKQNHILPKWLHFVMLMSFPLVKTPQLPMGPSPEPGARKLKSEEVKSPLFPSQFRLHKSGCFQAQALELLPITREMPPLLEMKPQIIWVPVPS